LYESYENVDFTDNNKSITTYYVGPLNLKKTNYIEFEEECGSYDDKQPIKTNKNIVLDYTINSAIIDFS
jgi:hypothetical protein